MAFIDFIRKNQELQRIFGKRELKIIEKQLLGVSLTNSEKVRLSRDIRKKFEIIGELERYKDEFKLKKGAENKKLINEVKEKILKDELSKRIKKIFIFGSFAEKENTLLSDLDIAVEFDKITEKEALLFRARVGGNYSDRLDIQVYNVLPEKIKKEINTYGKIVYKNE
jgi:predicted nucleotidyltransferase